jgi:hypothetical protein
MGWAWRAGSKVGFQSKATDSSSCADEALDDFPQGGEIGTMTSDIPPRRPMIRSVAFDEIGPAIGRLLEIARSDTGQSQRVADFLLAWWNGDDLGHFPILHLCNCDAILGEDMLAILAYLVQQSTTYASAWGYDAEMRALVEQKRDLELRPTLEEGHTVLAHGIDDLRSAITQADPGRPTDQAQFAGRLHTLATRLHPERSSQSDARQRITASIEAIRAGITPV